MERPHPGDPMSRAVVYGALLMAVAAASLVSCRPRNLTAEREDPKVPIRFVFTCQGGTYSVALAYTDQNKSSAWAIRKLKGDEVEWGVDPSVTNVTFKIVSKAGREPLPIDTVEHENGRRLKVKVRNNPGPPKTYSYDIDATCTPPGGSPVQLIIDPEFIVR